MNTGLPLTAAVRTPRATDQMLARLLRPFVRDGSRARNPDARDAIHLSAFGSSPLGSTCRAGGDLRRAGGNGPRSRAGVERASRPAGDHWGRFRQCDARADDGHTSFQDAAQRDLQVVGLRGADGHRARKPRSSPQRSLRAASGRAVSRAASRAGRRRLGARLPCAVLIRADSERVS
jgi:hypothetical protein